MNCTQTIEGPIPHKYNPKLKIYMPVKLERRRTLNGGYKIAMMKDKRYSMRYPIALRNGSSYIYALPGGGDYYDNRKAGQEVQGKEDTDSEQQVV